MADLADSPATVKNLPFKISTLNSNAYFVTAQPPKYHHPNVFLNFICQKFAPPNFALNGTQLTKIIKIHDNES